MKGSKKSQRKELMNFRRARKKYLGNSKNEPKIGV